MALPAGDSHLPCLYRWASVIRLPHLVSEPGFRSSVLRDLSDKVAPLENAPNGKTIKGKSKVSGEYSPPAVLISRPHTPAIQPTISLQCILDGGSA